MTTSDCAEDLIASVQTIIQQNLAEQRNLTSVEINQLCDCAWQLAALNEDCFDDYKTQLLLRVDGGVSFAAEFIIQIKFLLND